MTKLSPKKALNVSLQAESAEEQRKMFKRFLLKSLINKGFNVAFIHDSIIIEKETGEQIVSKYSEII